MHFKSAPQEMRLVASAALHALLCGQAQVLEQLGPVLWVCALVDDLDGALLRREASQISETLLGHKYVHIVFGVVHVTAEGHDSGDTCKKREGDNRGQG